ncbi:MAG TPA: PP2C family protein-serine/threonine phosphatase [Edaphobacter sp.]|nr:PP2C family protein-serine/threonine phosphatase [Edaphobacter sp.]
MNAERVVQRGSGEYRTASRRQGWNTVPGSMIAPMTPSMEVPPSGVPLQEDVYSLLRERADLHAQVFDAAQIQRKLSGPRVLRSGELQFASEVFAARFLSGDFTTLSQSGSRVLTVLGDIAGKGIAAGMWFTHLAGLLQSYGRSDSNPSRIATEINRHLCYLRPVAPFVTAFLALTDCDLGKLTYCNAGHFLPILLRADGRTCLLDTGGPLLGAIEGAEYQSGELVLEPGDTLVAYSDGVLECRNSSEEAFGVDRLMATLRQVEQRSAHDTLMMLLAAVQDFANGHPLCDDVSLTVIQRDAKGMGKTSSTDCKPWDWRVFHPRR